MYRLPRNSYEFNTDPNKGIDYILSAIRGLQSGGVSQIIAGTNVTISPVSGTGAVTINASGGGSTPTLDQVTTAGNTTANAISVGGLTSNASSIILGAAAGTLGSKVLTLEGSLPELFFKDTFSTGSGFSLSKYGSAFYFVRTSSTGVFTNYAGAIVNNSWSLGHGGNPNATVHIKGADVLSSTKTLLVQNSSPTDLLTIWNDGAVGINTSTNAGYKLDVNGTGRFVGSLNVLRSSSLVGFAFVSTNNDTLQWNNGTLDIQFMSSSPSTIIRLSNAVGGVSYLTSKININAPNVISNLGASLGVYGNIITSGSITASSALAQGVYFNNTLTASANNDVLVGLDINPTFNNGAFTGVSNYALRTTNSTVALFDSVFYSRTGPSSSNTFFSITGTQDSHYTISSHRKFVLNTGQSMYFNTDTDGGGAAEQNWYFGGGRSGTTGGRTRASITTDSSGFPRLIVYNNDDGAKIKLDSNAASYFNGGNVLIGTTTDAGYKLDVNGTLRTTGMLYANGNVRLNNSASTTGWNGGYYVYQDASNLYGLTLSYTAGSYYTTLFAPNPRGISFAIANPSVPTSQSDLVHAMFIKNTGNIGIGTSSPDGPLHVKYSSSTVPGITIENDGVGYNAGSMTLRSGTSGGVNMSVTSGGGLYWYNLNTLSNSLSLPSTGNLIVGGAVDAGYRLDVQGGDARFAQNVEAASYSVAGNAGYSGIINFPLNPPGSQNLEFLHGILINVF